MAGAAGDFFSILAAGEPERPAEVARGQGPLSFEAAGGAPARASTAPGGGAALPATTVVVKRTGERLLAGAFAEPTLQEAREAAAAALGAEESVPRKGRVKLSHRATNSVAAEHADEANAGCLFQAASQCNYLEHPASSGYAPADGITYYGADRTQGPACAVVCAAGTLARNYVLNWDLATQGGVSTCDSVRDAVQAAGIGGYLRRQNGYLLSARAFDADFARRCAEREAELRAATRVGLQTDTEVLFRETHPCAQRQRRRAGRPHLVHQCYCAAAAIAYDERDLTAEEWEPFARPLLEASYEHCVLSAATLRAPRCFLTFVGAGVFGNPKRWAAHAAGRAAAEVARYPGADGLEVVLLHFREIDDSAARAADEAFLRTLSEAIE